MSDHPRGSDSARRSIKVAVIGAGAAGLVTARELRDEGHNVTVFEASQHLGGLWNFTDEVEDDDLLGRDRTRRRVHSSMYAGLRTNLPREIMGYSDLPCIPECMGGRSRDARRYPGSAEIVAYFEAFADAFRLRSLMRLGTTVTRLDPMYASSQTITAANHQPCSSGEGRSTGAAASIVPPQAGNPGSTAAAESRGISQQAGSVDGSGAALRGWRVHSQSTRKHRSIDSGSGGASRGGADAPDCSGSQSNSSTAAEDFDAVVSCVGNYSEPNVPELPGMDSFPGRQLHSHNFRTPAHYAGQTVLVVGGSFSGIAGDEVARRVSMEAAAVYHCARSWEGKDEDGPGSSQDAPGGQQQQQQQQQGQTEQPGAQPRPKLLRRPMVQRLQADGRAVFMDGSCSEPLDTVIYCTGYQYSYPFLEGTGVVKTEDMHVAPLYRHIWPPATAPSLAFVGLLWKSLRYIQFEMQAKWVACVLSGRAALPSSVQMLEECRSFEERHLAAGLPPRYLHCQGNTPCGPATEDQWAYDDWLARECGLAASPAEPWRRRLAPLMRERIFHATEVFRDEFAEEELRLAAQARVDFQPFITAAAAAPAAGTS